ncbi:hypothetical protein BH10PSE3_BH10PSE3_27630 [soil metagenome]
MSSSEKIADVFKTVGLPTVTYVKRDQGSFERRLNGALDEKGKLCLVTGPSKTGKTTLYKEVLSSRGEIPLVVACDGKKTSDEIWKLALEAVDFDRVESRQHSDAGKVGLEVGADGKLGWQWLAQISTRLKAQFEKTHSETDVRKKVLAEPGPDLLVPILKHSNYTLVIEDFHYLKDEEKINLFQQWKRFIDNEISVIVLGTTHRAVDIADSNKDLLGRIAQIDVGHWSDEDLKSIAKVGFKYLRVGIAPEIVDRIATEAVGLPIVVQQVCLELFNGKNIFTVDRAKKATAVFTEDGLKVSFNRVAHQNYTQFKPYYETLISGPREKARKYRTYELVLACFTLDPIRFSLKRGEIDARLTRLELPVGELPPAASMNSTLGALKKIPREA